MSGKKAPGMLRGEKLWGDPKYRGRHRGIHTERKINHYSNAKPDQTHCISKLPDL